MLLKDYIPNLNKSLGKIFFSGVSFESSKIRKDNIFFAIKGNKLDGNNYIDEAIKKGANIIVTENKLIKRKSNIVFLYSRNPRKLLSEICYKILNINEFNLNDNYLAFSGIGNPLSFKKTLIKNKFKIIDEIIFPDHFDYKKKDIDQIKKRAKNINAKIITTEKDFSKISKIDNTDINFVEVDLVIENDTDLINFLKSKIYE